MESRKFSTKDTTNKAIDELIEKLSTNGTEKLDKALTKQLKTYCKTLGPNQEDEINYLGRLVLHQLEKNHAQIRYGSLLIIEYLFERSHLFRVFLCDNLHLFFEHCLDIKGFNYETKCNEIKEEINSSKKQPTNSRKQPLRPISWSKKLKQKAIGCIEYWNREFGSAYKVLENGHRFLQKQTINEPGATAQASSSSHQFDGDEYLIQKFEIEKHEQEFEQLENDLKMLFTQIDTCFDLLIPKFKIIEEKEGTSSDFHFRPMKGLSFSIILNVNVQITRDASNCDLLDNLKELCTELNKMHTSKFIHFLKTVSNLKLPLFESKVKELIENLSCLKLKIATILWKFNEIKITTLPETLSSASDKLMTTELQSESDSSDEFEDVPEREDLYLMKKIELEKNNLIKNQITPIEASPEYDDHRCRAPLPSGRLCPRRDKLKCPFHGKIIPRDREGLPIDADLKAKELEAKFQQESDQWKDPKYLKQLSIQTGRDLEGKSLKSKRKKYPNLIDLKKLTNTPRKRLMRKVCSTKMREKVINDYSQLDKQVHLQFSDQWSYALEN